MRTLALENYFKKTNIYRYFLFFIMMNISLFITSCSYSAFSLVGINDEIDPSLPQVKNIKVLPDVSSVGFEWSMPDDIKSVRGYVLYRLKNNKWEKIEIIDNALATHAYDSKLLPKTKYTYAIATLGKNGNVSPKSTNLYFNTSFISALDFVYASKGYARAVKIIWSPSVNPSVKRYIIERKKANTNATYQESRFTKIGSTDNRLAVEYFDTKLDDNSTYIYRIFGESHDGILSEPSMQVEGVTKNLPKPVSNIRASDDKAGAIWLSWDNSDDKEVVSYNVFSSDAPDGNFKKIANVEGNSYVDSINENEVSRYYKVTAIDTSNLESIQGNGAVLGQTLGLPPTPNITQSKIENNQGVISWAKIDNKRVSGYVVYRKSGYNDVNRFLVNGTTFIDKEMQEDTAYSYSVASIDANNIESRPSYEVKLTLPREEFRAITTTTTTYVNSKGEVVDKKTHTKTKNIPATRKKKD